MSKKSVKPPRSPKGNPHPPQRSDQAVATGISRFTWIGFSLAVFAFLLYANTLGHQYVLDDPLAITKNELVKQGVSGIPELFSRHYRAGTEGAGASALLYRPLSLVTFAVEWSVSPGSPFLGHFMNVLWYALTVGLLFAALRRLLHGRHWLWAGGAALLFAAHPLHTEVVANIKSRDEILNLFFSVAALYSWARWLEQPVGKWLGLSLGCYFLALLSKESAVMLLPVFPLASWFFFDKPARQSAGHALLFGVPVILFLVIRTAVLSQSADNFVVSEMDNPIVAAAGFGERSATSFLVLWKYFQLLVFPHPLLSDYSYRHLSVVNWGNWQALLGLALYGGLAFLAVRGLVRRQVWAFPIAAFLCGVALYSQLFVVIGTLFGERLLYAPSVWFCVGVVWLVWWATRFDFDSKTNLPEAKKIGAGAGILIAVAVLFSLQTISRNADWKDNLTLFSTDVAKAPGSVRLHNGMGGELYARYNAAENLSETEKTALLAQIEEHSNAAIAIRPNPVSFLNLGNAAIARSRYAEAIRQYEEALKEAPNYGIARINIGRTYLAWGRDEGQQKNNPARAAELFEKAVEYGMNDAETFLNLGTAYGMVGQNEKAIVQFEKAVQLDPRYQTAWRNLSIAYRAIGNIARAEECAKKADSLK
ncbi:MAG: tetratricopeptide repeat protein [Lewinellaceae bacterium]|nr:tetratricopeptide repeat protein [Lewinellaceae bacterium]